MRRAWAWLVSRCQRTRDDTVSVQWRMEHSAYDSTRGVDLPCWRSPKEIAGRNRLERRRAIHLMKQSV
jgi:hypothetical protein